VVVGECQLKNSRDVIVKHPPETVVIDRIDLARKETDSKVREETKASTCSEMGVRQDQIHTSPHESMLKCDVQHA
jgi:hypothetical protein